MKNVRLFAIVALLTIAGKENADELWVDNISIAPGEQKTVSVELNNPYNSYTLLEFSLSLPDGVSIAKDSEEEWLITPNASRFTSKHTLDVEELADGSYKFLIYSSRNMVLNGTSGEVFSLTLTVSEDAVKGTYQGRIFEQLFVDGNEEEYDPADVTFEVKIGDVLPGDVNGDHAVNVSDVTMLVSMILGNTPQNEAADVNGDNMVNVSDVTALVSIILGQ